MITIDGITYNVPVTSIKRKVDFLDKYAEITEDGNLQRKLIGVYFNYQLAIRATDNPDEYARLWDKLTEPVEFHTVTVPGASGDFTFTAYFSDVGDEIFMRRDNKNYWQNLTVNFIAKAPARR